MTNEEILERAIEKAKSNGWDVFGWKAHDENPKIEFTGWENGVGGVQMEIHGYKISSKELIFDHDFAKAFWGEKEFVYDAAGNFDHYISAWKYHLQQMVLEKEPLKYLEKFF
jgi:hypothetical protein